jgi:hypothetical protein
MRYKGEGASIAREGSSFQAKRQAVTMPVTILPSVDEDANWKGPLFSIWGMILPDNTDKESDRALKSIDGGGLARSVICFDLSRCLGGRLCPHPSGFLRLTPIFFNDIAAHLLRRGRF